MRLITLLLLLATTTALAAPTTGIRGDWTTTTSSIVQVGPCSTSAADHTVCLTIIKISPTAPETTDKQNPDASLRNRSLCGLVIGTGFHPTDPDHLTDGHLYDPKTGHTYRGTITAAGDTLQLHGYIGISLFGRTETWHRAPATTPCH